MSSIRDIKNKIRAVRNIEQICRAMKTVASIRLRRAEQRLAGSRPYRKRLADLVGRMAAVTQAHPFLQQRPAERTGIVLVTSDRGLCGGYNANAVHAALAVGGPQELVVIAVGRKALVQMRRRGYQIVDRAVPLGGEPRAEIMSALADRLGKRFQDGELDRVVLVYSRFLGGTRSQAEAEVLLPVRPSDRHLVDAIFEPAPPEMLPGLLKRYLRTQVFGAALEASASEHAARVAAMTAATDNSEEMIRDLTLDYNKARQAGITKELTELVGAAEATT